MSVDDAIEKQETEAGEVIERFMVALDIDEDIAAVLVEEGFHDAGRNRLCTAGRDEQH